MGSPLAPSKAAVRYGNGCMNEMANTGQMVTRRDRCTRIITTISRAGWDHEIRKSLDNILMWRGLSALTDAAIEDLATRVAADEHARRVKARCERENRVVYLALYRTVGKN
jgi:hypothetical protein